MLDPLNFSHSQVDVGINGLFGAAIEGDPLNSVLLIGVDGRIDLRLLTGSSGINLSFAYLVESFAIAREFGVPVFDVTGNLLELPAKIRNHLESDFDRFRKSRAAIVSLFECFKFAHRTDQAVEISSRGSSLHV